MDGVPALALGMSLAVPECGYMKAFPQYGHQILSLQPT